MSDPAPDLDAVFAALADPTRRTILKRLASGKASVTEIARPFEISQPAISRHLKVLEKAGLVKRSAARQTRPAQLHAAPMIKAVTWLAEFRAHWDNRMDRMDGLLADLQTGENR